MSRQNKLMLLLATPEYAPKLRCSVHVLRWITICCFFTAIIFETSSLSVDSASFEKERQASLKAQMAMHALREFRGTLQIAIDPILDPNNTGLIGAEYTDLTTTEGLLTAKRTATNPAFAGLMVKLMSEAGLKKGDPVAINMSGSFPSLNIATLAACEVMAVKPYIISSVGASTYGANIPNFTWLDMERYLVEKKIFSHRSIAVSLGGIVETQGGLDGQGLILAHAAIKRHGADFLVEGDFNTVEDDVINRKKIFDALGPIKAFINVGGSLSSLGWVAEAAKLDAGLLKQVPATADSKRGLVFRFHEEHVPVIHMLNVSHLAKLYALPIDPIPLPLAEEMSQKRFTRRYTACIFTMLGWFIIVLFWGLKDLAKKSLIQLSF